MVDVRHREQQTCSKVALGAVQTGESLHLSTRGEQSFRKYESGL